MKEHVSKTYKRNCTSSSNSAARMRASCSGSHATPCVLCSGSHASTVRARCAVPASYMSRRASCTERYPWELERCRGNAGD